MIDTEIFTLLVNRVSIPVFDSEAPQNAEAPYVIFTVLSESYGNAFEAGDYVEFKIQIDAYSLDKKESNQLIKQCIDAIKPLIPYNVSFKYSKEKETARWRSTLECTIAK